MGRTTKMPAAAQASEQHREALQEAAIGEALFASTLATLLLTNQVATGRMSHVEVSALLDGATLVLERHRGAHADNIGAVDYARNRLSALMTLLERMQQLRPAPASASPQQERPARQ
jgi:hypothetical protein